MEDQPEKRGRFDEAEAPAAPTPRKFKLKKKVYPAVAQFPTVDFCALLEAERERIERDSGAFLSMRGQGSGAVPDTGDPLHVLVEAEAEDQANKADRMVREVLNDPNKLPPPLTSTQLALRGGPASSGYGGGRGGGGSTGAFVKEVRVPEDVAGGVIGRGGETVRRLQEQSGARINILNDESVEGGAFRVIAIRGPSQDVVDRAELLVMEIVHARKGGNEYEGGGAEFQPAPSAFTEYYQIPLARAGAVIGRGGTNVKAIQIKFGVRISVPPDSALIVTPPGFRTLMIAGDTQAQIDAVKQEVDSIVETSTFVETEEPGGTPVRILDDKVGLVIGKQGATIKSIQERMQVRIQIPKQADPGTDYRTASVVGRNPEGVALAIREIEAICSGELQTHAMIPQGQSFQQQQPVPYQQQQHQQSTDYASQWEEYYRQLALLPPEQQKVALEALEAHQRQAGV